MMAKTFRYVTAVVVILLGTAIGTPPYSTVQPSAAQGSSSVRFDDVTEKVGLNAGMAEQWGDISVGDYDNSGWDSVYIGHHGKCNDAPGLPCTIAGVEGSLTFPRAGQLFHNARNGTFTDATSLLPAVTDSTQHRHFALWCDVEGTGYEDLIIGSGFRNDIDDVTGVNDLWLHNNFANGGRGFTDIAAKLGTTDLLSKVAAMTCGNLAGAAAGQGRPDVLLANLDPSPALGSLPSQHLWVNYGTRFREEGTQRGLGLVNEFNSGLNPFNLACADFRRIGTMDCLAVGSNYSFWFLSNRDGTFAVAQNDTAGIASLSPYNTDAYFADFMGHGLLDVAIADNGDAGQLRIVCNNGKTIIDPDCFNYRPESRGEVRAIAVGDFANSGHPSIFLLMSGGGQDFVPSNCDTGCKGPDFLLMNHGNGSFTEEASQAGLNKFVGAQYGAGGAAVIDYDMDGRLDLIVGYNEKDSPGPFRVYRNTTQNGNSWIGFRLKNRVTIGSWVTVTACGRRQVQQLTARTGWVHQSSRLVHFGLGQCRGPVTVETIWRTGQVTRFTLASNKYYWMTPTANPVPIGRAAANHNRRTPPAGPTQTGGLQLVHP